MDTIHRTILRRYHTLCSHLGLSEEEKRAIAESYGVESSRDLDHHSLIDICAKLSDELERREGKTSMDKLRKRAIAAIGGYLRSAGHEQNIDIIKSIACRATGYEDFNAIPRQRLVNVAATFAHKQQDFTRGKRIMMDLRGVRGGVC